MANFFDQFHSEDTPATAQAASGGNFFDKFDEPAAPTPPVDTVQRRADGVPVGDGQIAEGSKPTPWADPARDIASPDYKAPAEQPWTKTSDALRTGIKLLGGTTPQMEEQMQKIDPGHKDFGGYVADAVGGVLNAPRNIAETALAVGDELTGSDRARSFNEYVPKYSSDTPGGQAITTGGEMAVGGGGAYKLVKESLVKAPKFLGKVANWLGAIGAEATGAGVSASSNSDTLLIGEKSLFGNTSMGDDVANNPILQKKIDLAADALVTAAPISGVLGVGAKGLAVVKDLTFDRFVRFFSTQAKDDQVAKSVLSELGGITPDMPDDEIVKRFDSVIATINKPENKNLLDALRAKITPEEYARLTPDQKQVLDINRDTISAFEAGNAAGSAETAGARSLREGVIRTGAPDVQEAMARPVMANKDYSTDQMLEAGGRNAADEAASAVQQSGRNQVAAAQGVADDTVKAFEGEQRSVGDVIKQDPTFGPQIKNLGTDVNVNTTGPVDATRTKIGNNLEQKYISDTNELNSKAAAVGDDVKIDEKAFDDVSQTIIDNNLLSANDQAILANTTGFKELFAMTPTISKRINELMQRGESHLAQPLMQLRDIINNPAGGSPAVKEFRDYYNQTWSKNWKDGIGSDYSSVFQDTSRLNKETGNVTTLKPVDKAVGTNTVVDTALGKTPYTEQLHGLLNTPGGNESAKDISQLIVADSLSNVQKTINRTGTFTPQDFDNVLSSLEGNGAALANVDPAQAKAINDLATRLRDRKITLEEMRGEVETIVKGAAQAEKNILGRELGVFFKQSERTGEFKELANGFDSFDKLLNNPQAHEQLDGVITRVQASDSELAKKGLEAAWQNSFQKKFFSVAEDGSGSTKVKSSFIPDTKTGKNELLAYGEKIYADKPGVMTTMKALAEEADRISGARSSTSHMLQDAKTINQQGQSAFQMVTTFLFGPLSRTGSKVRSAGTKLLEKSNPEEYLSRLTQKILSDPDEFNRIVMPFMDRQRKAVPVEDLKALVRWSVNTKVKTPEQAETDGMQLSAETEKEDNTPKVFP